MKCQNCGFENQIDANVCSNCGNTLVPNQTIEPVIQQEVTPEVTEQPIQVTPVAEPPKKKKKGLKGFITFLIVVGIIVGLFFGGKYLIKKLFTIEDPFPDIDYVGVQEKEYDPTISFVNNIEADYANGTINTDQYMMQLAYSLFEPSKIDAKYSSLENDYTNPRDLFDKLDKYKNNISIETLTYISGKYFADYISWDTGDNSDDNNSSSIYDYEVQKVLVAPETPFENEDSQQLSKAHLTSNKHFIIYYTEIGNNAISGEKVDEIGEHLEKVVKEYKKNYGLDFKYENYLKTPTYPIFVEQVLERNNINKFDAMNAMPVYLINLGEDNAEAFYAPALFVQGINITDYLNLVGISTVIYQKDKEGSLTDQVKVQTAAATYAFPYIVINAGEPNITNTKLISAHELFHHYQHYICGDGNYAECPSGLFTIETTANLASAQSSGIDELGTSLTAHSYYYSQLMEESIDKVGFGYAAFVFANNYSELVYDGANKFFQSGKYTDPLGYLYKKSNGSYKEAMLLTAERSLTFDYKNKQFLPYPKNNYWSPSVPKAHNDITANSEHEAINYSSMHYYYVDPSTLGESKIYFKAGEQPTHDMTLLLFVKEENKYKKVYSHDLDEKFVIKASDWTAYDEIAFAIVESSVHNDGIYYTLKTSPDIKDKVTVTPKSLGLKEPDQTKRRTHTIMCYQIEETEYFKTGYQVLINLDKDEKINNMLMKGTIKVSDNVLATQAFDIAKKTAPGLILGIQLRYREMLKNVRVSTNETDDSWTVLFLVTKDYDDAFTSSFGSAGNSKEEIINAIKAKGFTCE